MQEKSALIEDLLTPVQVAHLDAFQAEQGLATRAEAFNLLIEIAIDVVTGTGDRFWDVKPGDIWQFPRRR